MEEIDSSFKAYKAIAKEIEGYEHTLKSEADVRLKVIDRFFCEILNWPYEEIFAEEYASATGFLDYKLTVEGLGKLVVEAKKDGRDLGIDKNKSGNAFKLNGPLFKSDAAKKGISQAIHYCGQKNSELACVTNGRQWIIFRGSRLGDGKDSMDGLAFVFGSQLAIEKKFKLFYELLSYESVKAYLYKGHFQEVEGHSLKFGNFSKPLFDINENQLLLDNPIQNEIDKIMISFFQNITDDKDDELLINCFVSSDESTAAEEQLARISEDFITKIKNCDTSHGGQIQEAIQRIIETDRNEFILLIGSKSAGKSSFIKRFFRHILPKNLLEHCVIVNLNLSDNDGDENEIVQWLQRNLLITIEKEFFDEGAPTFKELQAMYYDEYNRRRKGPFKDLYENNKEEFRTEFGRHTEKIRENHPDEYTNRLLHHLVTMRKLVPCLIFDNADHFTIEFQEKVFQFARAIYGNSVCLIVIPITDKTSWQITRQGALQSFFNESFFIPTVPAKKIIEKRIDFIIKKLAEDKEKGTEGEYFVGRGIRLSIHDLNSFVQCLQKIFIKSVDVATWISNLTNKDIRSFLGFTQDILTSPHLNIEELIKIYLTEPFSEISSESIRLSVIKGKYEHFAIEQNKYVQNIYYLNSEFSTTPLLALRILQYLQDVIHDDVDGKNAFVTLDKLKQYFLSLNIGERALELWIDSMLRTGLCLSYDPKITTISENMKIEISPSGQQHFLWGIQDWVYMDSLLHVTPINDKKYYEKLNSIYLTKPASYRKKLLQTFIDYLIEEDEKFCMLSDHPINSSQLLIKNDLLSEKEKLAVGVKGSRYFGITTGIVKWFDDKKGYGFIKQDLTDSDIFAHCSEIQMNDCKTLNPEQRVEFEVQVSSKGMKAIKISVI